jgi:hypothetical protein
MEKGRIKILYCNTWTLQRENQCFHSSGPWPFPSQLVHLDGQNLATASDVKGSGNDIASPKPVPAQEMPTAKAAPYRTWGL